MLKNVKRSIVLIFSISLTLLALTACGQSSTGSDSSKNTEKDQGIVITDTAGQKVKIPSKIDRIADSWPAHNEMVTMLGAGNKIVASISTPQTVPWLFKVNPHMSKTATAFTNTTVNTEMLLKTKPDIIFMPTDPKMKAKLKEVEIPAVQLNYKDFDSMKKVVILTGKVLGGDSIKKAETYNSYLDKKLKMVTDVTSKMNESEKPKVLHIISFSPLTVDGRNTIIDSWIKAAGGVNVAHSDINGNMKSASMEQVLKWNPDVIIVGSNTTDDKKSGISEINRLTSDPAWSQINAVKNKKVYINPTGAFLWDRYGAEEALQIQWAAKTLHPDKFQNIDIKQETKNFYKTFFNYNLTDDEVNKILNGKSPNYKD
ncbi:vitamin B12-binding protein [Clostridium ragsdalei P11]|uniref:Vitamin B12-binding protein n=1 Tax=Clostridium ragsdalei P11 TaxID=1353534 RepID=A0A1A6AUZ0_9CLOT|nr:ABC transporter substrate-binding protein [Clostridium ragsdalei]OBR93899.1 vitamin B12-binding protein [Clostridium ragsdalei P11]